MVAAWRKLFLLFFIYDQLRAEPGQPLVADKHDGLQVSALFFTDQLWQELAQEAKSAEGQGNLKNPTKIAIVFECQEYCRHWADVFVQRRRQQFAFSLIETLEPQGIDTRGESKQGTAPSHLEAVKQRLRQSKFIFKSSLLFFALQKNALGPKYNAVDLSQPERNRRQEKYQSLSRHLTDADPFYRPIATEYLLPLQQKNWTYEVGAGFGAGTRQFRGDTELQSNLSNAYHPLVQAKAVVYSPWHVSFLGTQWRWQFDLMIESSLADQSRSDPNKALQHTSGQWGVTSWLQVTEDHYWGLSFSQYNYELSVSNENFLGFGFRQTQSLLGLRWHYSWLQFSAETSLAAHLSDSQNFRGMPDLSQWSRVVVGSCPFSYRFFNFLVFPCAYLAVESEMVRAPGNSDSLVLNFPSLSQRQSSALYLHVNVRPLPVGVSR